MRTLFVLCISAFIAVSCSQKADNKNDTPEKPNIIIIFSDELMFEDISCCGGSIQTPNIDALAAGGLLFENTFTPAPMCTPSRFALLTGNYPGRCTHQVFIRDNPTTSPYCITWNTFLDSTNKTLPGILSDNGYITGMAGKWHLGEQFLRGYLAPDDSPEDPEVNEKLKKHQELVSEKVRKDAGFDVANSVMYANYDGFPVKALQYHNYPWVTKGAVDFIEQHAGKEKPFFLYLAGTSVHGPHHAAGLERDFSYTPGGKIDEVLKYQLDVAQLKSEIEGMESPASHRYCGMAFLDHQVGLIVNKLEELNITDNTLVLFLPDHNTEPAKATCYEKALRIPLIIKWPGNIASGKKSEARIQTIDILPTILAAAGVEISEDHKLDGKSFWPVIENKANQFRKYVFAESGYTRSVSDGQYKYIAFRYPAAVVDKMLNGEIDYAPNYLNRKSEGLAIISAMHYPSYFDDDQLFDLSKDPYEQHNLARDDEYADKLTELQEVLEAHLSTFDHPFDLSRIEFMQSAKYRSLVKETKKMTTDGIYWYKRDWGEIIWPPENK